MPKDNGKPFKVGDFVFAKVRGYTPWPAQITRDPNPKKEYTVRFYGSKDIGHVRPKNLWPYNEHKLKYTTAKNLKRPAYSRALTEIKCAFNGEPVPADPFVVPSTNKDCDYDSDYDSDTPAVPTAILQPKRKPKIEEKDLLLVYMPGAKVLGINIGYKKPKYFKNSAAQQIWQIDARSKANVLKQKLLSGEVDAEHLPAGLIIDDPSPRGTARGQEEEAKLLEELHELENALITERDFIRICEEIRDCLGLQHVSAGKCLEMLALLKELKLTKLMLLRHPVYVQTIRSMRKYVGNLQVWQLTTNVEDDFKAQTKIIRQQATIIYDGFSKLFNFGKGEDFWMEYSREVHVYQINTRNLDADLGTLMNQSTYDKICKDKQTQAGGPN